MIYLTLISTACMKIHQVPYVIFETVSQFSRHNSSVFFFSFFTCFLQKKPIKVHNFRLSTAQVKIHQIPHIIFQTKSPFFFKVWITSVAREIILLYFFSRNLYAIDKTITSKCKFSDLPVLALKFTNKSFLEPKFSFSSNFASLSSVMRHNSSEIFQLKHYMLLTKKAHQCTIFLTFGCSNESTPNSSCHF